MSFAFAGVILCNSRSFKLVAVSLPWLHVTREETSERRILKREGEKAKQKAQIGAGVWDLVPDVYPVNKRRFCRGAEDVPIALRLLPASPVTAGNA